MALPSSGQLLRCALISTEAQLRRSPAEFLELWIAGQNLQIHIVAHDYFADQAFRGIVKDAHVVTADLAF